MGWHEDECFICYNEQEENNVCLKCIGEIIEINDVSSHRADGALSYSLQSNSSSFDEECACCGSITYTLRMVVCRRHFKK
jgi:hypothetical protein